MTPSFDHEIDKLLTQAEALLQADKPGEALSLLDRARKLQPHHAWTLLFRGVALGQLGRLEEAIDQLIVAADENSQDIDIQVDTARYLSLLEQHQDALVCAKRAIELDTTDTGAQAVLAEILEHLGRISEAIEPRETVLSFDPEDQDNRYHLALDLCDAGQYEAAFEIAEPLFAEYHDDPDIVRLHGACLSYLGRHEEALADWALLERLEGVTPNLLHNRASTLDVLEMHDEALATIDEAIAIEPDVAMNYYTRGMIHEHRGDDSLAVDDYLAALTIDPAHMDAAINLIETVVATDRIEQVLAQVDALLDTELNSATLLYTRGRLEIEMGRLVLARADIENAIRREPSLGIAWYTLTMLYTMLGNFELAEVTAERALRLFPDDQNLWTNRGIALQTLKRYQEAMACFDRSVELNPEDGAGWIHIGRLLLLDLDRPADAYGALQEAHRLQPSNDSVLWMLALCALRLDRTEQAHRHVARLLDENDKHLWGRLIHAAVHAHRGDMDAAFADLELAAGQGYDLRLLRGDRVFAPLCQDRRFDELVRKHSSKR